jgi:hypothetical protein
MNWPRIKRCAALLFTLASVCGVAYAAYDYNAAVGAGLIAAIAYTLGEIMVDVRHREGLEDLHRMADRARRP